MGEFYRVGAVMVSHQNIGEDQYPLVVTRPGRSDAQAQGVFIRPCHDYPLGEPIKLGQALVPYTGELTDEESRLAAKALLLYA